MSTRADARPSRNTPAGAIRSGRRNSAGGSERDRADAGARNQQELAAGPSSRRRRLAGTRCRRPARDAIVRCDRRRRARIERNIGPPRAATVPIGPSHSRAGNDGARSNRGVPSPSLPTRRTGTPWPSPSRRCRRSFRRCESTGSRAKHVPRFNSSQRTSAPVTREASQNRDFAKSLSNSSESIGSLGPPSPIALTRGLGAPRSSPISLCEVPRLG